MPATLPRRRPLAVALALCLALSAVACNKQAVSSAEEAGPASAFVETSAADAAPGAPPSPQRAKGAGGAGDEAMQGLHNRNGSQLAYEHEVQVRLAAARIAGNLSQVREACSTQRFGACDVLGEELSAGELPTGMLAMRAAPGAVAGLVGLAADGGSIAQRSTRAEDLAAAVRDNGLRRRRLELQHAKLEQIMARRDARVEELIGLAERLAVIEAELQGAEQEAAQQQRRIASNLLTVRFHSEHVAIAGDTRTRIGDALRGLTSVWDGAIASIITIVIGGLLPFALLLGAIWWLVARLRRRKAITGS